MAEQAKVYDVFLKNFIKKRNRFNLFLIVAVICLIMACLKNINSNICFLIGAGIFVAWIIGFILINIDLKDDFLKEMCLIYKWSYEKEEKENTWPFIDTLEELNIYGSSGLRKKLLLSGKSCSRDFALYEIRGYEEQFFLVKTDFVKDFKNIILIRPKEFLDIKIKNLSKAEIDTQNKFEVYCDDVNNTVSLLPRNFLDALIAFGGKNIFLITPQGVLFTQTKDIYKGFSLFPLFSAEKQVKTQWQKVESFIKTLDLINLLEKK